MIFKFLISAIILQTFAITCNCDILPTSNCTSNCTANVSDNIYLIFYFGPTVDNYTQVPYNEVTTIASHPKFNKNYTSVFHFPGWAENATDHKESIDVLATAFFQVPVNFLVWNYVNLVQAGFLGYAGYPYSVYNVSAIGCCIGAIMRNWTSSVQPLDLIHLLSHSLGSQIMSKAARCYGPERFPWLTGLDPAGPVFNIPFVDHLSRNDGIFVDVIHTDACVLGYGPSIGTVDFYPNCGTAVQPYCRDKPNYTFCSHHMSWRYYAVSIVNSSAFPACTYKNSSDTTHMGYGVNKSARDDYYLETSATPPFSLSPCTSPTICIHLC